MIDLYVHVCICILKLYTYTNMNISMGHSLTFFVNISDFNGAFSDGM
jgi:hypothetical protein